MTYLDNAATSFPKPIEVYTAAFKAMTECGGNPSRSGHRLSMISDENVYECRKSIADMFGGKPENTVFTENATHALNVAIKGIAKDGGHFLISNMEHNAVLRPIVKLCEEKGCSYDVIDVVGKKENEIISDIQKKKKPGTIAVVMAHCSNLCSNKIPVGAIGAFCQKEGIAFILDASQSAGHMPISITKEKISILCAPAHKGLFGIMGAGFLISDGKYTPETLIEGGSGFNSADIHMPPSLPEHLEAGTLPVTAIASLGAGCDFIRSIGFDEIKRREELLYAYCKESLSDLKYVRIYRPSSFGSCFLFNLSFMKSEEVGELLAQKDICVRSGFHCAPLAHRSLGTGEYGAVRVSFSVLNTKRDIDKLYEALGCIIRERI